MAESVKVSATDGELTFDRSEIDDGVTLTTNEPAPEDEGADTATPPAGTNTAVNNPFVRDEDEDEDEEDE